MTTPYCLTTDLMMGQISETDTGDTFANWVARASDEVDSRLGFTYQVPFSVIAGDDHSVSTASRLLLKRITYYLATGRAIQATFGAAEDTEVNAYAQSLINDAYAAINMLTDGKIILNGALYLDGTTAGAASSVVNPTAPLMTDFDATGSGFDAFYSGMNNNPLALPYKYVTFDE